MKILEKKSNIEAIDDNPIFILGAPRSGTTFLASLLERSKYGAPFETHFITKYYKKLSNYGDIQQYKNFAKLLNDILSERPVMQWNLNIDNEKFFSDLGDSFTYAQMVNNLCLKVSQSRGLSNWGDKTPHYLADLDILYGLFPSSKFIYIVRDGRDVAISLLKKDWGPNNIYYCANYWKKLNEENIYFSKLISSNNLYQLKYEDLLDDVDFHVKKIYEFLNLDYDNEVLNNLSETVIPGNYDKWKKVLSRKKISIFESVAADTLLRFGYEITSKNLTVPGYFKAFFFLHNVILRARHLFIINIIDGIKIRYFGKPPFNE